MPSGTVLQPALDSYATRIAPQYRDAYQANFDHLVNGGVLEDSRILACYVYYTVSEYPLGSGPTTITVAYDQLAKTRSYDLYQKGHAAGRYGDDALLTAEQYAAADASGLHQYYRDMAAYDDITPGDEEDNPFTPEQPPAAP